MGRDPTSAPLTCVQAPERLDPNSDGSSLAQNFQNNGIFKTTRAGSIYDPPMKEAVDSDPSAPALTEFEKFDC